MSPVKLLLSLPCLALGIRDRGESLGVWRCPVSLVVEGLREPSHMRCTAQRPGGGWEVVAWERLLSRRSLPREVEFQVSVLKPDDGAEQPHLHCRLDSDGASLCFVEANREAATGAAPPVLEEGESDAGERPCGERLRIGACTVAELRLPPPRLEAEEQMPTAEQVPTTPGVEDPAGSAGTAKKMVRRSTIWRRRVEHYFSRGQEKGTAGAGEAHQPRLYQGDSSTGWRRP